MSPAQPICPLLSVGETAELARRRRTHVVQAVTTGALPVLSENPNARGRTPRWLIDQSVAMRWIAAGCPIAPTAVARG